MNRANWMPVAFFLAVALALLGGAYALPAGMSGQPGPDFFPRIIGLAMLALATALAFEPTRASEPAPSGKLSAAAAVAALTCAYLLLWGVGPFALRTLIFLALLMRLAGESWRTGAAVSAVLTLIVTAAFQYGLRVSLE